jgi:16S rRNA (cytosine1402-N4)-methyltransferase
MYHNPVMRSECLQGLNINPDGIYVDVTYGGGGHSNAILSQLKGGKLYAFDQDADAQAQVAEHPNLVFIKANFQYVEQYLKLYRVGQVDGLLADLGISSHQIDQPERGFSTRWDGPLDMRMNTEASLSAADVVNTYSEAELHRILGMYGELRNARTLALAIVKARSKQKISTTEELKKVANPLATRGKEFKYLAQVFQALRIEVNQEMQTLEALLEQMPRILKPGGRMVVMSYHSLEDRLVKHFVQAGNPQGEIRKDLFGNNLRPFESITRKPVEATPEELAANPRARSAKLRIAERNDQKMDYPDEKGKSLKR